MQVRWGAGLHARLPRRYGRKTILPVRLNAVPSHFHHAFLFFSCQATLTAPRRKTSLTTSVKSPTTSCELGWGGRHTESKRKQLHDLLPHLNTSREGSTTETRPFNREMEDDEGGERDGSSERMIADSSFKDTHRQGRRQYRKYRT